MQTQSARLVLPSGLALETGQLSPHSPVPAAVLKRPAGHGRQLPLTFPKPAAHTHSEASMRPGSRVLVFAEQALQPADPKPGLYIPVLHAAHGPASGPGCPGSHRQASAAVLASGLLAFGVHLMHSELPLAAFHAPSAHAAHGPPSAPAYPALHWQLVERLLPTGPPEFAGHAEQVAEPIASLYVDAAHAVHSPPSTPVYPALHLQ